MPGRQMRKVCANCKNAYIEGDEYCRYCGAKLGEPENIVNEGFAVYYGPPPIQMIHKCVKCGYTWVTNQQGQNRCPRCGGYAPGKPIDERRYPYESIQEEGSSPVLEMHLNNIQGYLDNVREYVDNAFARMENEENKEE